MQAIGLAGNLVDTPSVTLTKSGKSVARFTIAIDDGYRAADGGWTTRSTVFQKVEAWNDSEAAGEWPKGALVAVIGQLRASVFEVEVEGGGKEQRRAQWFAADVAAIVLRPKSAAAAAAEAPQDDLDDPYSAAR